MKNCPFCNAEIEENSRFCIYCMSPLTNKKVAAKIKPLIKGWQIITAALLVFALAVVLILSFGSKKPVPILGSSYIETMAETSDISSAISSEKEKQEEDNESSTRSHISVMRTPYYASSDNSNSRYPDFEFPYWDEDDSSSDYEGTSSTSTASLVSSNVSSTSSSVSSTISSTSSSASSKVPSASSSTSSNTSSSSSVKKTYIDGYYTYSVYKDEATITNVYEDISGAVTIPEKLGGYPVVKIGDNAFSDCNLITSVVFPDTLETIGKYAFIDCNLISSIKLPKNLISILSQAFNGCVSLESVTFPQSIKDIGSFAFYQCESLKTVTIPGSVTKISSYAFGFCENLTTAVIAEGTEELSHWAFTNCYTLKQIYLPKTLTTIGIEAFHACKELSDVWYAGSLEQKRNINIGTGNDPIKSAATWHYNSIY